MLKKAGADALGGGLPGAAAMVIQVLTLMWMRTTINFQHAKGLGTAAAMRALYAQGGIKRFYQGLWAALFQAPLSRFGDTASNAAVMGVLEDVDMPLSSKVLCGSAAAALFRIFITPIDAVKTMLQVEGPAGLLLLRERIAKEGIPTLYSGALGSSFATLMGHYPWFVVYNALQKRVPAMPDAPYRQIRSALIGFCCSFTSDCVSNSVRVVKTAKQTSRTPVSYGGAVSKIVAEDGVSGLFLRGLGTKLLSNGAQAMLFTVCWRYFEEMLKEHNRKKAEAQAAQEEADAEPRPEVEARRREEAKGR